MEDGDGNITPPAICKMDHSGLSEEVTSNNENVPYETVTVNGSDSKNYMEIVTSQQDDITVDLENKNQVIKIENTNDEQIVPTIKATTKRKRSDSFEKEDVETISSVSNKSSSYKGYKKRILEQTSSLSDLLPKTTMEDDVTISKVPADQTNNKCFGPPRPEADIEITKEPVSIQPPVKNKTNVTKGKEFGKRHSTNSYGDPQLEYAQYLGLQPSIKFKCYHCNDDSFQSYAVLKDHQVSCLSEGTSSHHQTPTQNATPTNPSTNFRITRKVYLCSACGTYYENWNLFLHMKTVHKRYICLFCLGMFSHAEKLSSHLLSKHNVAEKKYKDPAELFEAYAGSCFFMCTTCEHVFTERDNFSDHVCSDFAIPCGLCGLKGLHKPKCKGAPKASKVPSLKGAPVSGPTSSTQKKSHSVPRLNPMPTEQLIKLAAQKLKSKVSPGSHVTGDSDSTTRSKIHILQNDEHSFNPARFCQVDMHDSINAAKKESAVEKELINSAEIENLEETNEKTVETVAAKDIQSTESDVLTKSLQGENSAIVALKNVFDAADTSTDDIYKTESNNSSISDKSVKEEVIGKHKMEENQMSSGFPANEVIVEDVMPEHRFPNTSDDVNGGDFKRSTSNEFETDRCSVDSLSNKSPLSANQTADSIETEATNAEEVTNTCIDNLQLSNDEIDKQLEDVLLNLSTENDKESLINKDISKIDDTSCLDVTEHNIQIDSSNKINNTTNDEISRETEICVSDNKEIIENNYQDYDVVKSESDVNNSRKHDLQHISEIVDTEDVCKQESDLDTSTEESTDNDEVSEDVIEEAPTLQNKLPKITVKLTLPKSFNDKIPSETSSDSEDSEKLTMEIDEYSDSNNEASMENVNENKQNETEFHTEGLDNSNNYAMSEASVLNDVSFTEENILENHLDNSNEITMQGVLEENDHIQVAGEEVQLYDLTLEQPLHKFPIVELLKKFLNYTKHTCLYCNHARKIAVNGKQIGLHLIGQHRFRATVESITAEELYPKTIVKRIKECLKELESTHFNLENYDSTNITAFTQYDGIYECFQCKFVTKIHKELYLHNRKCHQKAILLCIMCKNTFYTYSELLCHFCPGNYEQVVNVQEVSFRCCLCDLDNLPSAFRLMVHLRKRHHACDVCLESCGDQSKLSNHVWKHKLHHVCYRCGIAYRNKPDITKHLFWKHGTESVLCKRCLQKKWPHVYHFCTPPNSFVCEECNFSFTRAVALKVHKRLHNGLAPYPCTEEACDQKFISKKLLLRHVALHNEPLPALPLGINIENNINPEIKLIDTPMPLTDKESDESKENDDCKKNKKSKKSKKSCKDKEPASLVDVVVNLPALNLSESDSSDESDHETKVEIPVKESPSTNEERLEDITRPTEECPIDEEAKPIPVVDNIWDNFKSYQASIENKTTEEEPIRLHVCQSDHDYCLVDGVATEQIEESSTLISISSPKKKMKSPKKKPLKRGNSASSSSSDSSSSTDSSSCTCGSNCSCSSNSGSSSSSSSSSDSDSSSSENKRKTATKRERRRDRFKNKKKESETSIAASNISAVDIMGIDEPSITSGVPTRASPPDIQIYESDLETEESETDEDFYDEHPQRLANKLLAEKRNQLMLLAAVGPSSNGAILDNSRPSTPSLPPEEMITPTKKKVKTKKRKKDKKSRSSTPIHTDLTLKLNIPAPNIYNHQPPLTLSLPTTPDVTPIVIPSPPITSPPSTVTGPSVSPMMAAPLQVPATARRSDYDSKRASKRRRIPNKFYGYSSDDDGVGTNIGSPSITGVMKPQPPPQLTWRKEDLPTPSPVRRTPPPPPSRIVEPPRVPPLPVHHILQKAAAAKPPSDSEPDKSSDTDSDTSDEGALHISQPPLYVQKQTVQQPQWPVMPPPAGARQAREGESVYCYCRCPYDEVSEMIACDGSDCAIEWFHFECVGIMVPPKGKWYCPDCRQSLGKNDYFFNT